jgi:hypothetical protein
VATRGGPALIVVLSLLLKPRVSRMSNITVSLVYMISVVVSCMGETRAYYVVDSVVEALLLAAIARTTWRWPRQTTSTPAVGVSPTERGSAR